MDVLRQGLPGPLIAAPIDWLSEATTSTCPYASIWDIHEEVMMFLRQAFNRLFALIGFLCVVSCAQDTSCTTSITNVGVPSTGTRVQLEKFSYCGGILDVTAYVEVSLMS
jgi:hypothetical protein